MLAFLSVLKCKRVDGNGLCLITEAGCEAPPLETHFEIDKDVYFIAQSMVKTTRIKRIIKSFRLKSM